MQKRWMAHAYLQRSRSLTRAPLPHSYSLSASSDKAGGAARARDSGWHLEREGAWKGAIHLAGAGGIALVELSDAAWQGKYRDPSICPSLSAYSDLMRKAVLKEMCFLVSANPRCSGAGTQGLKPSVMRLFTADINVCSSRCLTQVLGSGLGLVLEALDQVLGIDVILAERCLGRIP
jgi:hypothetical protein